MMAPLSQLDFDIDHHLNRLIPSPPWPALPYPVSYFFGYRRPPYKIKHGNVLLVGRAMLGVFTSLLLIQVVSHQIPWVALHGPRIVASFGAAAVLEFYAYYSPFAQPRNVIVSQIFATVIGVSFCKLFQLRSDADWVRWLGGALACATTTALMGLTKTVHPPAGATALLAVIDDTAVGLGWKLIPLVLLGCAIMLFVALIVNNVFSRFPLYWWTAGETGDKRAGQLPASEPARDPASDPPEVLEAPTTNGTLLPDDDMAVKTQEPKIIILRREIFIPMHVSLSFEERLMLQKLATRL
ncbi:HPP family-domain-containing protein [Xylaria sp. CBS 124048]|nr:HPP family-domain-containing protein [Xylaria sp. CBS 124048]